MILKTSFALAVLCGVPLLGQSGGFTFATQIPNAAAQPIQAGGTIQFASVAVGSSAAVTLSVTSSQTAQWTISSTTITGTGFAGAGAGTPVLAGSTSAFLVTFTPAAAGPSTGTLSMVLTGPSGQTQNASFNLAATGSQGVLVSYLINPNGNQTLVTGGGTILFPQTLVSATTAATVTVSNRSSDAASFNSAALAGGAYQLSGLPLFPASIPANTDLHFTLTFTPTAQGASSGTLTLVINGSSQVISLSGVGAAALLSYSTVSSSTPSVINPGDAIALGSAPAGSSTSQIMVIVRNNGNLTAQLSGVSVSAADFSLPGLPALPASIPPGGSLAFTVAFTPRSPGNLSATLTVGNVAFTLTGTGLGPNLTVSLVAGSQRTLIAAGGTATIPSTGIGSKMAFALEIDNTGNQAGTVTSLKLVGNELALVQAPPLPATVPPGGSIAVSAVFAPTSLGIVNGYLQMGSQAFGLTATGEAPPALPSITFNNVTSQMSPLLQPALGLTLATPYPYDLTGLLTLTFDPDSPGDDPNIEFISGTRVVPFQVPANSTQAVFGSGSSSGTSMPFQTGTTAGVINLAASFALGSFDVTAGNPVTQTVTIAPSAPAIRSVEIASESSTAVTLLITGYSTPRSVQSLSFSFIAAPGASLSTTALTADVSKAFDTWFQSASGVSFGSQFAITVQLNVSGAMNAISSIAVSAANAQGASAPVTIGLQ